MKIERAEDVMSLDIAKTQHAFDEAEGAGSHWMLYWRTSGGTVRDPYFMYFRVARYEALSLQECDWFSVADTVSERKPQAPRLREQHNLFRGRRSEHPSS